ncbi:hypothetical protein SAMN05444340_1482 [Citreimonas salinaria]|uniref:Uncharacterized protein n=1 Tax=Citreimonas salinaria TaxID=321339 RepID=A0A1H3P527_9RHOB|nr:hypothetical protein SAMN05444340_1482 [Citreimonas salinaria]
MPPLSDLNAAAKGSKKFSLKTPALAKIRNGRPTLKARAPINSESSPRDGWGVEEYRGGIRLLAEHRKALAGGGGLADVAMAGVASRSEWPLFGPALPHVAPDKGPVWGRSQQTVFLLVQSFPVRLPARSCRSAHHGSLIQQMLFIGGNGCLGGGSELPICQRGPVARIGRRGTCDQAPSGRRAATAAAHKACAFVAVEIGSRSGELRRSFIETWRPPCPNPFALP